MGSEAPPHRIARQHTRGGQSQRRTRRSSVKRLAVADVYAEQPESLSTSGGGSRDRQDDIRGRVHGAAKPRRCVDLGGSGGVVGSLAGNGEGASEAVVAGNW